MAAARVDSGLPEDQAMEDSQVLRERQHLISQLEHRVKRTETEKRLLTSKETV